MSLVGISLTEEERRATALLGCYRRAKSDEANRHDKLRVPLDKKLAAEQLGVQGEYVIACFEGVEMHLAPEGEDDGGYDLKLGDGTKVDVKTTFRQRQNLIATYPKGGLSRMRCDRLVLVWRDDSHYLTPAGWVDASDFKECCQWGLEGSKAPIEGYTMRYEMLHPCGYTWRDVEPHRLERRHQLLDLAAEAWFGLHETRHRFEVARKAEALLGENFGLNESLVPDDVRVPNLTLRRST